ncbi:uncharacterized protein O3C94_017767 [Discoglossus pictus]
MSHSNLYSSTLTTTTPVKQKIIVTTSTLTHESHTKIHEAPAALYRECSATVSHENPSTSTDTSFTHTDGSFSSLFQSRSSTLPRARKGSVKIIREETVTKPAICVAIVHKVTVNVFHPSYLPSSHMS